VKHFKGVYHTLRGADGAPSFWNEAADGPPYTTEYYRAFCVALGVPEIADLMETLKTPYGDCHFEMSETAANNRANKNGRDYTLPADWMKNTYIKQRGRCALSGLPMFRDGGLHCPYMPVIDRIDSDGSYTPDNCRLLCHSANMAKGKTTDDAFSNICAAIHLRKISAHKT